jgi:predicted neutral ceramidase superfamily lipid hydrolase
MDLLWLRFTYKHDHWYQKYYVLHNFIRDPLLALVMIAFHDYPIWQISIATLIMVFSLVMNIKAGPFIEAFHNKMMVVLSCLYVVVNIGFLFLYLTRNSISRKAQYNFFGFSLIALVLLIIISELIIATKEFIDDMKEKCKKRSKAHKTTHKRRMDRFRSLKQPSAMRGAFARGIQTMINGVGNTPQKTNTRTKGRMKSNLEDVSPA